MDGNRFYAPFFLLAPDSVATISEGPSSFVLVSVKASLFAILFLPLFSLFFDSKKF